MGRTLGVSRLTLGGLAVSAVSVSASAVQLPPEGGLRAFADASGTGSATVEQASGTIPILLVNGYFVTGNYGYDVAYRSALQQRGYRYACWSVPDQGSVTTDMLNDYKDGLVIWSIGYLNHPNYPGQFNAAQQSVLAHYLAGGGNLIITGAHSAYRLDETPLFPGYPHVEHLGVNIDFAQSIGEPDSIEDDRTLDMDYVGYLCEESTADDDSRIQHTHAPGGK